MSDKKDGLKKTSTAIVRGELGKDKLKSNKNKWTLCTLSLLAFFITFITTTWKKAPLSFEKNDVSSPRPNSVKYINIPSVLNFTDNSSTKSKTRSKSNSKKAHSKYSKPQIFNRPFKDQIPRGLTLKAQVLKTVPSGATIHVKIKESPPDLHNTIPSGSVVLGKTSKAGNKRVLISFNRLILPNGKIQSINAQAIDKEDKLPGIRAKNINPKFLNDLSRLSLSIASGISQQLKVQNLDQTTFSRNSNLKSATLNGLSQSALSISDDFLKNTQSLQDKLIIKSGTELFIAF